MVTQSWCQGVNPGTSGVSVVDTYDVETQYMEYEDTSNELLYDFTEDMIDNDLNSRPKRTPYWRNGRSETHVPIRTRPTENLFQTSNKCRLYNCRCNN